MGVFVDDEGRFQGWLAALLCCFVALNEDESPAEREREKTRQRSEQKAMCYEQPLRDITALPSLPLPVPAQSTECHEGYASRTGLLLKDEKDDVVVGSPKPPITRRNSVPLPQSCNESGEPQKQSQQPRKAGPLPQRQGLVPLRLGPVVLRDFPESGDHSRLHAFAADTDLHHHGQHKRSESTQMLLDNAARPSYITQRKTPYQHSSNHSTQGVHELEASPAQHARKSLSAHELGRSAPISPALDLTIHEAQPQNSNPTTATPPLQPTPTTRTPTRLKRKRPELPRTSTIEQEVLELHNLISARRAQPPRPSDPHSHIPAIAPSMLVRARSETLETIGSAFSRPIARLDPEYADPLPTRHRVSGWLSHLNLSTSAPTNPTSPEPFYKCRTQASAQQASVSSRSLSRASSGTVESPTSSAPTALSKEWHGREEKRTDGDGVGVAI